MTLEQRESVVANAKHAATNGYVLVSGGAIGVDKAAENAFDESGGLKAIWGPEDVNDLDDGVREAYEELAAKCHRNWKAVQWRGQYVKNLLIRNAIIVDLSDVVLAWPHEDRTGGTEHGIEVAKYLQRPLEIMKP
jgi:predicted Rossmann fold nucleotide-binding protein DprA/Smf involved in DNA uptake